MKRRTLGLGTLGLAAAGAVALIALELAKGAAGYGEARLHDPCSPRAGDAFVLKGMDAVACARGESREQLLLDAADSPIGNVATSVPDLKQTIERWLEAALEGQQAHSAKALEEQTFRVLDGLFAR